MKQRNRSSKPAAPAPTPSASKRTLVAGLSVLAILVLAAAAVWFYRGANPALKPVAGDSPATSGADAFSTLKGRWLRPDGGYVLEFGAIDARGIMECRYYNPKPIRVAKATAALEGAATRVFVELRDEGYPGCTYNLAYDPREDVLSGTYFQAAVQETYEVVFVRMK
jgi:hypothetical protein